MDTYLRGNLIGSGGSACIFEAVNKNTQERVALKWLNCRTLPTASPLALEEVQAMLALRGHDNVITLKDAFVKNRRFHLILDLMKESLSDRIQREPLNLSEIKDLTWQLLKGVAHIHTSGFIHRDLKPANVLLDDQGSLKICDFGLARPYLSKDASFATSVSNNVNSSFTGSYIYSAPESLRLQTYGPAVDMWAVGCIIAELFTGKKLFPAERKEEQLSIIETVLGDLEGFIPSAPPEAMNLIANLVHPDVQKRLTVQEALEHPFFNGYKKPHCRMSGV